MMDAQPNKTSHPQSLRLLRSILLGVATVGLITLAAAKLPYSPMRDEIMDYATAPAQVIADFFYPVAARSGTHVRYWTLVFTASGAFFYSLVWFCVLSLVGGNVMTRQAKKR